MKETCKHNCFNGWIYLEATGMQYDCPDCRSIDKALEKTADDGRKLADTLMIPEHYYNAKITDHDKLFKVDDMRYFTTQSMHEVENVLTEIFGSIYSRESLKKSYYIFAPSFVDIRSFVYSTQLYASVERQLNVSPYISLNGLNSLRRISDYRVRDLQDVNLQNPLYNTRSDIVDAIDGAKFVTLTNKTYSDFVNADVCFLRATASTTERGWQILADILDERASRNKATVVFGYYSTKSSYTNGLRFLLSENSQLSRINPVELISINHQKPSVRSEPNIPTSVFGRS